MAKAVTSRRVLITGANGFVGRHLIAHLLEDLGNEVSIVAAVRPEDLANPVIAPPAAGWSGRPEPRVEVAPLDLLDSAQAAAAVRSANPDWIVHLAARSSGAASDRDAVFAVNVSGTRNVLEAAAHLSPFPRTLVISTGYVYGSTEPGRPAREEDPVGPLWRYGAYADSKIEMESVVRAYRAFAILVRPFAHSGPGQGAIFALPAFARQLARIEAGLDSPVIRVGNLNALRDILDARDVVRAYADLLVKAEPGDIFNVAVGKPVSIGEALERLRKHCSVDTELAVDPERLRPADIACSSGDPLKLWAATGWSPRIPLDTMLQQMLGYWRSIVRAGIETV